MWKVNLKVNIDFEWISQVNVKVNRVLVGCVKWMSQWIWQLLGFGVPVWHCFKVNVKMYRGFMNCLNVNVRMYRRSMNCSNVNVGRMLAKLDSTIRASANNPGHCHRKCLWPVCFVCLFVGLFALLVCWFAGLLVASHGCFCC